MTAELQQAEAESPQIKSGFIFTLSLRPGGCGHFQVTSESKQTEIQLFIDHERDEACIKITYWGDHSQLEKIADGQRYPMMGTDFLLKAIEQYLQGPEHADTGTQAS